LEILNAYNSSQRFELNPVLVAQYINRNAFKVLGIVVESSQRFGWDLKRKARPNAQNDHSTK